MLLEINILVNSSVVIHELTMKYSLGDLGKETRQRRDRTTQHLVYETIYVMPRYVLC